VWIKVSPRHPLLKAVVALPVGVLVVMMLVFILIVLGFTLLAVALMTVVSRGEEKDTS
jgi:protein-S-isoprenylcysteine O-methyltransferase Ste14